MFYSFDTSSILNGRRDLLPPSAFPSVWGNVEAMIEAGNIRAVDVVREELLRRDDEVAEWAKGQQGLFVPLTHEVQLAMRGVVGAHPELLGPGGKRNMADPFVIALAIAEGGTVVTEETATGNIGKPRIPDVCEALGVPCLRLVTFVQEMGWTF